MMTVHDPAHLRGVIDFALKNNCLFKLAERLEYLDKYSDGSNTCHLHPDFAPNSFAFAMERADGSRWFNGGLIYSGPEQPLDGSAPALTVGVGIDNSKHSWSVHT